MTSIQQLILDRPSFSERGAYYGTYRYQEDYSAGRHGWIIPDPIWVQQQLVKIPIERLPGFPLFGGTQHISGVTFHRKVAPAFELAWAEVHRQGLHERLHSFDGAFAARHMLNNPRNPLSNHANGSAIDFDASTNGFGLDPRRMQIDEDFVRVMESFGWSWGGRWNPSDGMHFEWVDPTVTHPAWQDSAGRGSIKPQPLLHPIPPVAQPEPEPVAGVSGKRLFVVQDGDWVEAGVVEVARTVGDKLYVRNVEGEPKPAPDGQIHRPDLVGKRLLVVKNGDWRELGTVNAATTVGDKLYLRSK